MDCNKDEARRGKEVAEEKMVKQDFEGARKIALKAKQLFPELDNISQIIAVCDVHCSAQKNIYGGGKNLYAILQVENLADETTIRKQYRKLALLLHPDKNKFPGAEAAFKLIGEANMILSDKEKRLVYDVKYREPTKTAVKKVHNRQGNQTSNAGQNKFKNGSSTKSNGLDKAQRSTSNTNIRFSFWTYCPFCTIKYEYNIEYVNRALRCQNCSKLFIAYDIGAQGGVRPGFVNEKTHRANLGSKPVSQQKETGKREKAKVNKHEGVTKSNVDVQKPMETKTAKDTNKKRGRKTREESNESSYDESAAAGGEVSGGLGGNSADQRRSSRQKQHVSYQEDGDDEFSPQKRSQPKKSSNDVEDIKEHVSGGEDTSDVSMPNDKHKAKEEEAMSPDNLSESDSEPELVDCPDQEFCNFDKDKEEHCFAVDQIWACYDSVDGMPRFYAQIRKVYSSEFRLRFTWLESEPKDDLEIKWVEEGLPVACGEFVCGEAEETRDRLMFSHQVVYTKKGGSKVSYAVSPQKGETWALYKDWDIKWSLDPESHKKFKFDIVEILSVHDDCVTVAFLLKVKGFTSVFQRGIYSGVAEHTIPSNERFRFSHRIPSAKLNGTERAGVPTGSFELDMASLPSDLEDYCYYYSNNVNTPKKNTNGLDNDLYKLRRSPRGLKSPNQENADPCPMPKVGSVNVNDGQNSSSACGLQVNHNFRSESPDNQIFKFQIGQIWAFWERAKGTCLQYAQIKQIEYESLRLHVSLLNPYNKPGSGYSACGLFKVSPGKPKILAVDSFSHIVKADVCGKKIFNIHPREQQIWALCKSQDAGECEIVEVVGTDEVSINVMSLTRVSGSKLVFKASGTQSSTGKIVVIPRVELNRFSRQIPAFYFTDDCLRGCWELDPAAVTGLQLLEPNQC
ncbi:hypothetical protein M8C21_026288 [Ambrosia artemisiifolia]|uniref:J domain-containing protein n=1 Tax=Ambrosia artemisiifolia TaxID=4212 RepID=A0AAD5GRT5_AMBAR|nr:hypothetical protein M8C21_026288 [Ambrosia artemisiifolia]